MRIAATDEKRTQATAAAVRLVIRYDVKMTTVATDGTRTPATVAAVRF